MSMNLFKTYLLSKSTKANKAFQAYNTGDIGKCENLLKEILARNENKDQPSVKEQLDCGGPNDRHSDQIQPDVVVSYPSSQPLDATIPQL